MEKNSLFEKAALTKRLDERISQLKEQEERLYNERKSLEAEKENVRDVRFARGVGRHVGIVWQA